MYAHTRAIPKYHEADMIPGTRNLYDSWMRTIGNEDEAGETHITCAPLSTHRGQLNKQTPIIRGKPSTTFPPILTLPSLNPRSESHGHLESEHRERHARISYM